MKKTLIALSTFAILLFGGLVVPTSVSHAEPSSLEEVQKEREKLKEKLNDKEKEIAKVLDEIEELHNEVVELENGLKANEKALDETNEIIEEYNEQIDEIQNDIDEINVRIEERAEILKTRLASYQSNGGNISFIEVVLGSKGFNDFISRLDAVTKINKADTELIEQQEADREKVEALQDEVVEKLEEQEDTKVELEGMQQVIEEQKENVEKSKQKLDEKKEKLTADKSKLNSEDRNLAALEETYRPVLTVSEDSSSQVANATAPAAANETNNANTNEANETNEAASTKSVSDNAPKGGVVSAAMSRVGKNNVYVWGGKSPSSGFDCSGFVSWAYGGSIPSSTAALQSTGTQVSLSEAQPGDLIFFDTYKKNGHVGIYLGNGKWIGSQSSTGVAVASVNDPYYWGPAFKGHVRRVK